MLYIGIDLSDKFFDSCITDSQGAVLSTKRFQLKHDGFCSFIKLVHEHEVHENEHENDSHKCIIGLENPRSRLVDFLAGRGYTVMQTNPNAISSYRYIFKSVKPSKAKSDKADAKLIADYLREHHIQIADETIRELSLLLEDRDRLVKQKVRFSNQLISTLKEYFPQALDAFRSIERKLQVHHQVPEES
jgi:transposase